MNRDQPLYHCVVNVTCSTHRWLLLGTPSTNNWEDKISTHLTLNSFNSLNGFQYDDRTPSYFWSSVLVEETTTLTWWDMMFLHLPLHYPPNRKFCARVREVFIPPWSWRETQLFLLLNLILRRVKIKMFLSRR